MGMKSIFVALLGMALAAGCGMANKGLDTPIDVRTQKDFGASCSTAFSEIKDANPKEFQVLRDNGFHVHDLAQPREQVAFSMLIGYQCQGALEATVRAASEDNINLKTFRDIVAWTAKKAIDKAIKDREWMVEGYIKNNLGHVSHETLLSEIDSIKKSQRIYSSLTGKSYGPDKFELPPQKTPSTPGTTAPSQSASSTPPVEPQPQPAPALQSKQDAPLPVTQSPKNMVEQDGLCKGLDLAVTAEQVDCLDKKYSIADKQLNDTYKKAMASLDEGKKSTLKKEQITWVKEKESKCAKAGEDVKGGTLEVVLISDCKVQMTEKRLAYLKNYK